MQPYNGQIRNDFLTKLFNNYNFNKVQQYAP
jgi:hypothetical protein